MQPVTLNIYGEFWDSQIYRGRLYLFCCDGSIKTLDWDRLISSLKVRRSLKLATACAFMRSDYLYGDRWSLFFSDPDIKKIILRKFQRLAEKPIEIETRYQDKYRLSAIGGAGNARVVCRWREARPGLSWSVRSLRQAPLWSAGRRAGSDKPACRARHRQRLLMHARTWKVRLSALRFPLLLFVVCRKPRARSRRGNDFAYPLPAK